MRALDVVLAVGVPSRFLESLVAPGIKSLTSDRAPNVREAFFRAVARWLGYTIDSSSADGDAPLACAVDAQLRNTVYAPVLLPLLLLGVSDSQAGIASEALQLVQGVGEAYCASSAAAIASDSSTSNSNSASEGSTATGMDVDKPQQPSAAGDAEMPDVASSSGAFDLDAAAAAVAEQLGHPYAGRPAAAARQMVQQLLPRLLPPVVKELGEWTIALRGSAARSLHTTLVLAEDATTNHLQHLIAALCTAIADEDADVARNILGCVHTVGRWVFL